VALKRIITIGASAFDATLTNYAARVSVPADAPGDVWFSSDAAGASPIAARLLFSGGSGPYPFGVAIASASSSVDTVIYQHEGNKPGGYDTDPYDADTLGVYLLASDFADSTSNGHTLTPAGGLSAGGGGNGPDGVTPATHFDGSTQSAAAAIATPGEPFTIIGWGNLDADVQGSLASYADASDSDLHRVFWNSANDEARAGSFGTANANATVATGGPDTGNWHHYAGVFAADDERTTYYAGAAGTPDTTAAGVADADTLSVGVNGDASPNGYWDGKLASLSFHAAARSASWIKADCLLQGPDAPTHVTSVFVASDGTLDRSVDRAIDRSIS